MNNDKKQILALDADQVLFNYCSAFISFAVQKGYHLDIKSAFDTYNMSSWFLNMSSPEFIDLVLDYNSHEHPPLFPEVNQELIGLLLDKYEVCVVTAYSDCSVTKARRQNILLSMGLTDIHMVGLGESKLDILKEIGSDNGNNIFVDDNPKHILEGIDAGWDTRTISWPYNQGYSNLGVIYMESLWQLI